jgi:Metallo-beta-lactamase superfamily
VQEIAPGIWHWTAKHPKIGIDVSSYFLAGPNALLDPLEPSDDDRLDELGPPTEILLTNRHHLRDAVTLAERFSCAIRAPAPGMHEFSEGEPVEPYEFGDELAGGQVVAYEVGHICPDEAALHIPSLKTLAAADGVIHYGELRFVPDEYLDEPEQTKKDLKAAYGRLAEGLDFDNLLLAHGNPVVGGGREALKRFAASRTA